MYSKTELIDESRECHSHKPQPIPDTKRKRRRTKNQRVQNKQTNAREAHRPALSSPSKVTTMIKELLRNEFHFLDVYRSTMVRVQSE